MSPPSGQTCIEYLQSFIDGVGGYVGNPNDAWICHYCPARTTSEFLASKFEMKDGEQWRDIMIVIAISLLNVCASFFITMLSVTD